MNRNLWLTSVLYLFLAFAAAAQQGKTSKPAKQKPAKTQKTAPKAAPDLAADEKKVRDLIAFFQFMLNTVGSKQTSSRDKDVLITESYAKVFRDSEVQIEDDLDTERKVITNKDIVAYLKDVDYFFNDVKFEFAIEEVKTNKQPNGEIYYEVVATRHLSGFNSDGKQIANTQPRHIEVNYSPENQDLKIVSIYTNQFDEKEALKHWWNELSLEWKEIFQKKLNLPEPVEVNDIKNVTAIQEMDLSKNMLIQNIDPLSQLPDLRSLTLAGVMISDLSPLRNLTRLTHLNLSRSRVKDLSPLKYSSQLKELNIDYTEVSDISVLEKMPALETLSLRSVAAIDFTVLAHLTSLTSLDIQGTQNRNFSFFENLSQLAYLNASGTPLSETNSLRGLVSLETLDLDSTRIVDVQGLRGLEALKTLRITSTTVSDLTPLQNLLKLEKIYCDQTRVNQEALDVFARQNPGVLVVFDSQNASRWWEELSPDWKSVLAKWMNISADAVTADELARLTNIDSVNISGKRIASLEPLRRLTKVRSLVADRTDISDLSPLQPHTELSYLDISETAVTNLSLLNKFSKLKILRADKSKVQDVEELSMANLKRLYADQTTLHDILAREFLEKNPNCLLIYKTSHLERWWTNLPETWKVVFENQLGKKAPLAREDLHRLVEQEKLQFKDEPINTLSALSEFVRLKELHISGTVLTSVAPPENILNLTSLHITHSPIQKLDSIGLFTGLEDLDISDTPVDDIYEVWRLKTLKKFNCSGTQVKRLDVLERLENLEYLDCSNTNVSKLGPLEYLPLKTLRCYNTKASNRTIENFKESHPECSVMYYR